MPLIERIDVDAGYYLSPPQAGDEEAYVQYLNDAELYRQTLMIPSPYTRENAEWFFAYARNNLEQKGRWLDWTIRQQRDGALVGGISFHGKYFPAKPGDEIGYWLGKPFRGQGIMTRVLRRFCSFGFNEYGFVRLEAPIYAFNTASEKVLLKCGFTEEGYLRKVYFKNGVYIDAKLFARIRDER